MHGYGLKTRGYVGPITDQAASGLALDGLSGAGLTSLRAAWWTKRLLTSYGGTLYDARHLYDQSGNGKTLTSAANIGTTTEGSDTALVLDAGVPNSWTRSDALGLAADPALTIVLKARCTNDNGSFPTLLSTGTAGDSEFNLYFDSGGFSVTNFENDRTVLWFVTGHVDEWNTWILTKPAGGGYANTWRLYRGTSALGAPTTTVAGALALGNTFFQLGDFDGGGFPFGGHLAGMVVFEREFTGADLALVQAL